MKKQRPKQVKRAMNAVFAARFPRKKKSARRKARRARVLARELGWLERHGIEPEEGQRAA